MDSLYSISILQESYNNLPVWIKTTLDINEGEIALSGWKQFKSRYYSRRLAYEPTEDGMEAARSRFIELFFDNQLLLAQIRDTKKLVAELVDLGNWKYVSTTIGGGSTKSTGNNVSASNSKDEGSEGADSLTRNTISDSNSYGESEEGLPALVEDIQLYKQEGLKSSLTHYPINSLNHSGTVSKLSRRGDNKSVSGSVNENLSNYDSVSRTESSNTSDDLSKLLHLELPLLRNRFWDRFSVLFQYV